MNAVTGQTAEKLRQTHARIARRNVISQVAEEIWQRDSGHLEVACGVRGINATPGRYTTQDNAGLPVERQF